MRLLWKWTEICPLYINMSRCGCCLDKIFHWKVAVLWNCNQIMKQYIDIWHMICRRRRNKYEDKNSYPRPGQERRLYGLVFQLIWWFFFSSPPLCNVLCVYVCWNTSDHVLRYVIQDRPDDTSWEDTAGQRLAGLDKYPLVGYLAVAFASCYCHWPHK